MITLMTAAALTWEMSEADVHKVIEMHMACRENSFPQARRDQLASEAAKAAYVRKRGGTSQARKEIEIACELYRLAHDDGGRRARAVERSLSPEVKAAIDREIEREFGLVDGSQPGEK